MDFHIKILFMVIVSITMYATFWLLTTILDKSIKRSEYTEIKTYVCGKCGTPSDGGNDKCIVCGSKTLLFRFKRMNGISKTILRIVAWIIGVVLPVFAVRFYFLYHKLSMSVKNTFNYSVGSDLTGRICAIILTVIVAVICALSVLKWIVQVIMMDFHKRRIKKKFGQEEK